MRPRPPKLTNSTVEHVRCFVPAGSVHATALTLFSGMFPMHVDPSTTPLHVRALHWFGDHLFPAPMPSDVVLPLFQTRARRVKIQVDNLVDYDDAAILDLVHVTHSALVAAGEHPLHGGCVGSPPSRSPGRPTR